MRSAIAIVAFTAMFCAHAAEATPAASGWRYTAERDAMRGTTTRTACIRAVSHVDLAMPYHAQVPVLCVREHSEFIMLPRGGQFLTENGATVRVDDGPLERYRVSTGGDGSSDTLWIKERTDVEPPESVHRDTANGVWASYWAWNATVQNLPARLAAAHRVVIEVQFYRNGTQQVTFDVSGLKL